ncbi:S49 family peptidase [Rickettsia endosymbiont of Cardiosporidium cionae]|uniref:S49 family peptidase n=1 Tax=Rickettsia endosymbiont of Cardiosporidium cionae TaxID=2777155 RepID=UPI0018953CE0|nr:S49 family peptidase [Rickettsia endosymbiont of Cardiosporidium cionae]KAF8818574.1 S49 family peptidase [Rickettsia endosymbiont of Cardiosporidium cionae]
MGIIDDQNLSKSDNLPNSKSLVSSKSQSKIEQFLSSPLTFFGIRKTKSKIAVLRLEGVIGKIGNLRSGMKFSDLNKLIESMFKIKNLEIVILIINSPGGSPVQSELIARRLINLGKEYSVPIYSFIEDIAASGGYWLACAGEKIFAAQNSVIGSIGVISTGFGFHGAISKLGIERRVFSEGKSKSVLDPFSPLKETDIKIVKNLQQTIHQNFIEYIKQRRSTRLTQNDDVLFNGEFWSSDVASNFGLIDGLDDIYSFINRNYDMKNVDIQYIESKRSWFKKKLGINSNATIQENCDELINNAFDTVIERIIFDKYNLY